MHAPYAHIYIPDFFPDSSKFALTDFSDSGPLKELTIFICEALDRKTALSFLLDYHGNEGAIQEQKAPFAVGKVWKKQAASAHMKVGWWELERESNVRAGRRHRECVLY